MLCCFLNISLCYHHCPATFPGKYRTTGATNSTHITNFVFGLNPCLTPATHLSKPPAKIPILMLASGMRLCKTSLLTRQTMAPELASMPPR